jgi:hypothetical protein
MHYTSSGQNSRRMKSFFLCNKILYTDGVWVLLRRWRRESQQQTHTRREDYARPLNYLASFFFIYSFFNYTLTKAPKKYKTPNTVKILKKAEMKVKTHDQMRIDMEWIQNSSSINKWWCDFFAIKWNQIQRGNTSALKRNFRRENWIWPKSHGESKTVTWFVVTVFVFLHHLFKRLGSFSTRRWIWTLLFAFSKRIFL